MTTSGVAPSRPPFYLEGNYAPVLDEVSAFDLPVRGTIPAELRGRYVRNGPNPRAGDPGHWFAGDGMLHGIELRDGTATWFRNRWVRTKAFAGDGEYVNADLQVDFTFAVANTHIVGHAGRMFALVESSFPTEVTPELDTVGTFDFGGGLDTAMTAHPKRCPITGELHFFGYGFFPPYLTYYVADAEGTLIHRAEIDVPGPTMMHDFNLTESRVVFMDLPVVFDVEIAMSGSPLPYRWDDDYGARLGVLPRRGTSAEATWYDIDPCYVFHPANAYDDGDAVVLDAPRYPSLWSESRNAFGAAPLWRWRIEAGAGKVVEEQLDDAPVEFPRMDPRRVGLSYRYHYDVGTTSDPGVSGDRIVKYDRSDGSRTEHDFGPGRKPGEAVFVPASEDAEEDAGWLLTYVYDAGTNGSEFVILDAGDLATEPVAVVTLPQRVPHGFHGSWIPDPD